MQLDITGRNFEVTPALKTHAAEKMNHIQKHFADVVKVNMVLQVENNRHIAEASTHYTGAEIHAKAESNDMYRAIDEVTTKLETQLHKHKEKIIDSHR